MDFGIILLFFQYIFSVGKMQEQTSFESGIAWIQFCDSKIHTWGVASFTILIYFGLEGDLPVSDYGRWEVHTLDVNLFTIVIGYGLDFVKHRAIHT